MRVCVLTTSYPRTADDVAGLFVAEAVAQLRSIGIDVDVVSPASFHHFGIAFGNGIVQNLRTRPWLVLALPLFLIAFARSARRAARCADVVHAHWIPSGFAALFTGKPFVLQVWGTDVELARRVPWLARPLLRRPRLVIAASSFLAEEARVLGAREVRLVPNGVAIPAQVGEPTEPPHVLFVGRLSDEKGILEFLAATEGSPRVIIGDGPLRSCVQEAIGFVRHDDLGRYYEAAAVVCVPSKREGYGVVAREAMAYGRPVVATRVGGLIDAIEHRSTGVFVPERDTEALRAALSDLLQDAAQREAIGNRAREYAMSTWQWPIIAKRLSELYEESAVVRRRTGAETGR